MDFLGCLLFRPAEIGPADDIELGYRLHKAAWGRPADHIESRRNPVG